MSYVPGYSVTMRRDKRTGEYLAVISKAYRNRHDERYYMAIGESDGCWTELSPAYLTRATENVTDYPDWLKRRIDQAQGYILHVAGRLYG